MILAAGKSTRLGEIGARVPKPMLLLRGRPILEWTIERLRTAGISEIAINLHHAADIIPAHFGDGSEWNVQITYFVEEDILGTAGAVTNARAMLADDSFLLVYGDTVLDWDPTPMIIDHLLYRPLASVVVAEVEDPSRLGVVSVTPDWRISGFVEKPGNRPELGRWVNAGLCIFEPAIFEHLPTARLCDFGKDVFPLLLAHRLPLRAYPRPRPLLVVDTPEQYAAARHNWWPAAA
jgi:mannose-1-phosphate guanylyltransferase/phosphomannomutase